MNILTVTLGILRRISGEESWRKKMAEMYLDDIMTMFGAVSQMTQEKSKGINARLVFIAKEILALLGLFAIDPQQR